MIFFFIITLIYFIIRYYTKKNPSTQKVFTALYGVTILISQYIGIITNYGNGITADTFISNLILKLLRVLNTMNMNLNMPRNNKVEVDRKVDRKVDKKLIEKLIKMLIILKLIQNAEKLKIRGVTKIQIEHIPEIQITMTSIFTPPAEIISKQTYTKI